MSNDLNQSPTGIRAVSLAQNRAGPKLGLQWTVLFPKPSALRQKELMQRYRSYLFVSLMFVAISGGFCSPAISQEVLSLNQEDAEPTASNAEMTTRLLIVGKGKVADPEELQKREVEAVERIAKSAGRIHPDAVIDSLAENVMTMQQYRRGAVKELVTGGVFRDRLQRLVETAKPQDTVVIYTHSHGCRNGFEQSQPLGGIVIDLPIKRFPHGGTMLWDEYADLLLRIPAKNVIVFTMSCFSGGFVDYLNSTEVEDRWKDRRAKEGRNFIVLTSQNDSLTSDPVMKGTEIVNPFTYAVAKALDGDADGFVLEDGKPTVELRKDSKLSVGELIDFILYTTKNTASDRVRLKNTANPMSTGSFNRDDVLFKIDQ